MIKADIYWPGDDARRVEAAANNARWDLFRAAKLADLRDRALTQTVRDDWHRRYMSAVERAAHTENQVRDQYPHLIGLFHEGIATKEGDDDA